MADKPAAEAAETAAITTNSGAVGRVLLRLLRMLLRMLLLLLRMAQGRGMGCRTVRRGRAVCLPKGLRIE